MSVNYTTGFIAAASSPLAMTFGFIIWGKSWQGSAYSLNVFKCTMAGLIFMIVAFIFPSKNAYGLYNSSMIILSSVIGIIIGDNTWLLALQIIGAKRVIVIDALKPFFAGFAAYFILGEPLTISICIGVLVSSIGVVMVSTEHTQDDGDQQQHKLESNKPDTKLVLWGYSLAAINVLFDAFGSVLTKQFGSAMNTWEINFLRFGFAAAFMISLSVTMLAGDYVTNIAAKERNKGLEMTESMHALTMNPLGDGGDMDNYDNVPDADSNTETETTGQANSTAYEVCAQSSELSHERDEEIAISLEDKVATDNLESSLGVSDDSNASGIHKDKWYIFPRWEQMTQSQWSSVAVGVMFVTFLCPALANYALFQLPLSLCLTLNSLGPVYSIPLVYVMVREKSGMQSIVGAFLAVGGIALMCL